ncbi:hypothetical protein [Stenotrophomonas sp.]|uniref:hypothetical protein n=1 Tax=Stenotrophomonas sp. TaxID=69392 RepID=UPI0028A8ECA0|nr:hypothetical protein [Stenotrophomonas sp.]
MGYSAQYLTDEEWMTLHAAYKAHGSGPEFWQVYQELQLAAQQRTGDSCIKVANEMARVAQRMGLTEHALFV